MEEMAATVAVVDLVDPLPLPVAAPAAFSSPFFFLAFTSPWDDQGSCGTHNIVHSSWLWRCRPAFFLSFLGAASGACTGGGVSNGGNRRSGGRQTALVGLLGTDMAELTLEGVERLVGCEPSRPDVVLLHDSEGALEDAAHLGVGEEVPVSDGL